MVAAFRSGDEETARRIDEETRAGLRAAQGRAEPDRDQGRAEPARPRGRRAPPAARAGDRGRGRAGARLPRARGAARSGRCVEAVPSSAAAAAGAAAEHVQFCPETRPRASPRRVISPAGDAAREAATLDPVSTPSLRVIPLGGLGEVGKNMTVFEHEHGSLVVDAGLAFPRDEHLGVDLVLPDFSYLRERPGAVRAVVLTHAHEDHVGALPYLLREVRGARGVGDAPDARARQVEARRARAAATPPSCARSTRRARRSRSARSGSSSSGWRTPCRTTSRS